MLRGVLDTPTTPPLTAPPGGAPRADGRQGISWLGLLVLVVLFLAVTLAFAVAASNAVVDRLPTPVSIAAGGGGGGAW